ncbi:hypothetical protein GGI04_002798 [Coemansia thaxteri]|uniref:Domain of unknown function at the cortex 1 domain-containing protein n=1 Tax=Coemansia thaxteri TaxID=2663907 RepID=A0A9W8EG54_9FUNG|nr:hypothetical protein GGI04_002798 [Coemansia thaxteri]KAJ2004902.1 hypothetical protein H4R26_002245 [Coemansia thaxteri]KAJ2471007.1 hypothetical protein GGI02_002556 [Coemansia sp. RSA 2322]KAJ2485098.1 hypothetical protein EV174_001964 [Coemansia sp. RSA 2320]
MMLGNLFGAGLVPSQNMYDPMTSQRLILQRNANYVLRVRAGPNNESLQTIDVNYERTPLKIDSPHFKGYISVRVFGFNGLMADPCHPPPAQADYFANGFSRKALYSIQVVGQFLGHNLTADNIMFGNYFDQRLPLPPFSGLFEWFMKRMDRTLALDIKSDNPSATSPLLATVQKLSYWKGDLHGSERSSVPEVNNRILRDIQPIDGAFDDEGRVAEYFPIKNTLNKDSKKRRRFFEKTSHRQHWKIQSSDVYACDFFSPFIDVNHQCVRMPNAVVEPMPFFDGDMPLRYECRTRNGRHTFFVVQFELIPASRTRPLSSIQNRPRRQYRDSGYEREILDPPPPYSAEQ